MFLIFSVSKIPLCCILENAGTSLYVHCLSLLIMSDNRCFNTAERIQIMTMNECKRLKNNNLKSTYNYKYLIRLLSKTM